MELSASIGTLSLTTLFGLLALATTVLYIVYAAEWENDQKNETTPSTNEEVYKNKVRTEFSYYATVIVLLMVLASMHGYAMTRELL
jgi:Ca2+/Na+ antiporter